MDKTTTPDAPLYEYLSVSTRDHKKTQVFIKFWKTPEIATVSSALNYLIEKQANYLNSEQLEFHLTSQKDYTVILEANQNPKIVFGRSAPNLDQAKDLSEILSVLAGHGINARIKT